MKGLSFGFFKFLFLSRPEKESEAWRWPESELRSAVLKCLSWVRVSISWLQHPIMSHKVLHNASNLSLKIVRLLPLASGTLAENETFETIPKRHFLSTGQSSPCDSPVCLFFPMFYPLFCVFSSLPLPGFGKSIVFNCVGVTWRLTLGLTFFDILSSWQRGRQYIPPQSSFWLNAHIQLESCQGMSLCCFLSQGTTGGPVIMCQAFVRLLAWSQRLVRP